MKSLVRSLDWGASRVTASLVMGGEEHEIWVSANEDLFRETDFLLPIALLPAMKVGGPLNLPGKVSTRLLSSTPQIQDIFNMWESVYHHIPLNAEARDAPLERGSGVAAFFTGGVDSFHTALRHREEISHLVYLRTHPLEGDSNMKADTHVSKVREAARAVGKPLIEVTTNLPEFARRNRIPWQFYYGMAIASVALLFQQKFRKVLIAGSTTSNYDNLRPQGTHPILDPLWSTELTEFCHDGCEVRRVEKAAYIADYPVAMRHLQVCDWARDSHNCGHCNKCVRSMLNLIAARALERCETLPDEIDLADILALDLSEYSESYFARENLRALKRGGAEPEVVRALEESIERGAHIIAHSGYKEESLDRVRSKLRESSQEIRDLKRAKRNAERRAQRLAKQYSSLRYRLVDGMLERILKIPGLGVSLQEINTRLKRRRDATRTRGNSCS